MSAAVDYDDDELVERLHGFSSDSPYEEELTRNAGDRLLELKALLDKAQAELSVYYANCTCNID